jgi:Uma2 family endonuclease
MGTARAPYPPVSEPTVLAEPDELDYPASDGEPMAETGFHVKLIAYFVSVLEAFFRARNDVYVGADMFWYYERNNPKKRVAPDVFVAFGVAGHERKSWFMWREDKVPEVVFEFTSESTSDEDTDAKKKLYERLGVQEYFLFDPLNEYLKPRLQGYRLSRGKYHSLPVARGQVLSAILGLTLKATGNKLDLYVTETGERLLSLQEETEAHRREVEARRVAEAENARLRAELARLRRAS